MVPMAIPTFGGMVIQVMTVFVVPLFQAMWREGEVTRNNKIAAQTINNQLENESYNI
jgi:Cu(I)/Ag(I) efflux system membrane protein CusA/SilA